MASTQFSLVCIHFWVLLYGKHEVFGIHYNNIALGKPTSQSGVAHDGYSSKAVDGNTYPHYMNGHGSCTHTDYNKPNQWWTVDLLSSYQIHSVAITNRALLNERLKDFDVYVSERNPLPIPSPSGNFAGPLCLHYTGILPSAGPHSLPCNNSIIGRYVYLFRPSTDPMTICEFEVKADSIEVGSVRQSQFIASDGQKSALSPFYTTTIRVESKIICASVCMSRKEKRSTAVQFEKSTKTCQCIEKSVFMTLGPNFIPANDWDLLELATN